MCHVTAHVMCVWLSSDHRKAEVDTGITEEGVGCSRSATEAWERSVCVCVCVCEREREREGGRERGVCVCVCAVGGGEGEQDATTVSAAGAVEDHKERTRPSGLCPFSVPFITYTHMHTHTHVSLSLSSPFPSVER